MSVQSVQAGVGERPGGPGSSVTHLRPHPCVSPSPCSCLLKYHLLLEAFLSDISYLPQPQSFLKGKHSVLYSGTWLTMSPPPCGSWRKAWPEGHPRLWFSSGNSGNLCSPRQTPSHGQRVEHAGTKPTSDRTPGPRSFLYTKASQLWHQCYLGPDNSLLGETLSVHGRMFSCIPGRCALGV